MAYTEYRVYNKHPSTGVVYEWGIHIMNESERAAFEKQWAWRYPGLRFEVLKRYKDAESLIAVYKQKVLAFKPDYAMSSSKQVYFEGKQMAAELLELETKLTEEVAKAIWNEVHGVGSAFHKS